MLSLIIPVYNEAEVLPMLFRRLASAAPAWGMPWEAVLVDDGSTDESVTVIRAHMAAMPELRLVRLSRNFGHQRALTAGLDHARGAAVVILDADLQDPPELIPELLARWRDGCQVVYAIRQKRKEGLLKRLAYKGFYRVMRRISDLDIPLDSGDFCLMDRQVVDTLRLDMPEHVRFVRGLRTYVGFRQEGIPYARERRQAGKPKYTFRKLMGLAFDGIFGFSLMPLRLASYTGFLIAIPSFLTGVFFVIHRIFNFKFLGYSPTDTPGLASLAVGLFFLGGVVLIMLGIIGEYLGRIYLEVKRRPVYIVAGVEGRPADDTSVQLSDTVDHTG